MSDNGVKKPAPTVKPGGKKKPAGQLVRLEISAELVRRLVSKLEEKGD